MQAPRPPLLPDPTFLVLYRPGPAWLPGRPASEQPLLEHGRYLLKLYAQGKLAMAGALGVDAGGAVALRVEDEAEARKLAEADPAVVSGVFRFDVHRWALVDWAQLLAVARR